MFGLSILEERVSKLNNAASETSPQFMQKEKIVCHENFMAVWIHDEQHVCLLESNEVCRATGAKFAPAFVIS